MRKLISLVVALLAVAITTPVAADEVVIVPRHEERIERPRKHRKHRKVVRREHVERREEHRGPKIVIDGR